MVPALVYPLHQHLPLWRTAYILGGGCYHSQEQLSQVRRLALSGLKAATGASAPKGGQHPQKKYASPPSFPAASVAIKVEGDSGAKWSCGTNEGRSNKSARNRGQAQQNAKYRVPPPPLIVVEGLNSSLYHTPPTVGEEVGTFDRLSRPVGLSNMICNFPVGGRVLFFQSA